MDIQKTRWTIALFAILLTAIVNPEHQPGVAAPAPTGGDLFFDSGQALGNAASFDVALGDLDGDTDLDAFVANGGGLGEVNEVWRNLGNGVFTATVQSFPTALSYDVALGDVDGDTDLDAAVTHFDGITLWLNDGNGQFADSGQFLSIPSATGQGLALGDLDGDTDLDLFAANNGPNAVWLNGENGDPQGTFSAGETMGNADSESVALGYVNVDGILDAVLAGASAVEVWFGDGDGTFTNSGQAISTGQSWEAAVADLDGDTDQDVFVARNDGANQVWLNDGSGVFSNSGQSLSSGISLGVSLADLDGDLDVDAFVSVFGTNKVWLNDAGTFTLVQSAGTPLDLSYAIGLGDLDGDADVDAFVAKSGPNEVWLNQPSAGGTGWFNYAGFLELYFYDTTDLVLGDVDGDDDLDIVVAGENGIVINNSGQGTVTPGQTMSAIFASDVALGDVDGDDDLDLLFSGDNFNAVWMNQGGVQGGTPGTFEYTTEFFPDDPTLAISFADLDNDSDLDVAMASVGNNEVWLNDGGGNFTNSGQNLGTSGRELALGDLDGDADQDLIIVGYLITGTVSNQVWMNQGGMQGGALGTFAAGQGLGFNGSDVALGDMDADGELDVYITARDSDQNPNHDQIWFNNGQGVFQTGIQNPQYAGGAVALGDFRGLGVFDIFLTHSDQSESDKVLLNTGTGYFNHSGQCLFTFTSGSAGVDIALGDLDADADLDVVIIGNGHLVFWQNGAPFNSGYRCCSAEYVYSWYTFFNLMQATGMQPPPEKTFSSGQTLFSLTTLYQTRDEILNSTAQGQTYISLYYAHDFEIFSLLVADEALFVEAANTLNLWQPNLQALVEGEADQVVITAAQVQAVDAFLTNLSAAGSPALQQAIATERAALPEPETFIGMTMEEARGIVVGYGIFLPMIRK